MKTDKGLVLITGASAGIGYDLALRFAKEGHPTVLSARNAERLEKTAAEIRKRYGAESAIVPADLSKPGAASQLYEEVRKRGLEPDILVNNAGVGIYGLFKDTALARELEILRLNIMSLTELTKQALPAMLKKKSGRILNVASTASFQPGPLMAVYFATKAYVLSFSEAIAYELRNTGISVSALCPGPTRSEFQAKAGIDESIPLFKLTMMNSGAVADAGYRGLMSGKRVIVPGLMNKFMVWGTRFVPRSFAAAMAFHIQEKNRGAGA
jgi:uncharacterized protein